MAMSFSLPKKLFWLLLKSERLLATWPTSYFAVQRSSSSPASVLVLLLPILVLAVVVVVFRKKLS